MNTTTARARFLRGAKDGLPICLGYIPISFAFGMMARESGLPLWAAVMISMTNFTSAGQFAGTSLILAGGPYFEVALTTFIINIRYMLMSLSLSQKVDTAMSPLRRAVFSFGNTDEIFAIAMQHPGPVSSAYLAGLELIPYLSWSLSTLLGATTASLLPAALSSALGIAIYGMFLAIIIPPLKKVRSVALTVIVAVALSYLLSIQPLFSFLSSGWRIILCAVVASAVAALRYPVDDDNADNPAQPEGGSAQ